jgi:hypothetical protein
MTGWKACRTEALVSNDSAARGDHCRSFNSEFAGRKFGMRISFMNVDPRRAVESRIGNTENGSHSLPQTLIMNFRWFGPGPIGFAVQRIYSLGCDCGSGDTGLACGRGNGAGLANTSSGQTQLVTDSMGTR